MFFKNISNKIYINEGIIFQLLQQNSRYIVYINNIKYKY